MKTEEFAFHVPAALIATAPLKERSQARMLIYKREARAIEESRFIDLGSFLKPGDCLVFNETKVEKVRFYGKKLSGSAFEGLLLPSRDNVIRAWMKGKFKAGDRVAIHGWQETQVLSREDRTVTLDGSLQDLKDALRKSGELPLPPYILAERSERGESRLQPEDDDDYQTIFAKDSQGFSSAAPTASLHFDRALMDRLHHAGIEFCTINLRVGAATFEPIDALTVGDHKISREWATVPDSSWQMIQKTRAQGGRIIAVGTTVMRTLESAVRRAEKGQNLGDFEADLYIHPPFEFKLVDGLVTNFHWERSSLLVLVATFIEAKKEGSVRKTPSVLHGDWKTVYELARSQEYRFYSFGDGMLIL